jgi:hypothetical protein
MDQDSLLRRSLVLTGTVVGISAVWVMLVSLILVLVTDRAMTSLSHSGTKDTAASGAPAADVADAPSVPRGIFNSNSNVSRPKPNG